MPKPYTVFPERAVDGVAGENSTLSIHEINSKVLEKELMRISDSLQA